MEDYKFYFPINSGQYAEIFLHRVKVRLFIPTEIKNDFVFKWEQIFLVAELLGYDISVSNHLDRNLFFTFCFSHKESENVIKLKCDLESESFRKIKSIYVMYEPLTDFEKKIKIAIKPIEDEFFRNVGTIYTNDSDLYCFILDALSKSL